MEDPYRHPKVTWTFCRFGGGDDDYDGDDGGDSHVYLQSFLNILHLKEITGDVPDKDGLKFVIKATAVKVRRKRGEFTLWRAESLSLLPT